MFDLTPDFITRSFEFISQYTAVINHLLSLVILIVLLPAIYRKSGSAYSLIERIWFFLLGGRKYSDEKSNAFYDNIRDMEKFNAVFNINAKTPNEYKKIRNWVIKYDLEIKQISKIKNNLTIETLKIKKQKPLIISAIFISIFSFFALTVYSSVIANSDSALLQVKSDGTFLNINTHGTSKYFRFFHDGNWELTPNACLKIITTPEKVKKAAEITKLDPKVINVICKMYAEKDFNYMNQAIEEQKIFWKFSVLFLIITLITIKELFKAMYTWDARIMLLHKYKLYRKSR